MDCEYFEDLIVRMPDGELTEAELNALHTHIDGCADCRALFHAIKAVQEELTAPVEVPDTLCSRVMDAIARETAPAKPTQPKQGRSARAKRQRWRYGDLAIMAACAALVVAVLGVSQLAPRYGSSADTAAVLTAEVGFAATEETSAESALPAEEESAPMLGAALPVEEDGTSADTAETAEVTDTAPQETRSVTANTAGTGAQEADSAAEAPMDAAAPEFAAMPGVAAAVPDGADVFDPNGVFVGLVPSEALDRLFTEGDAGSAEPNGEPDFRIVRGGIGYELFVLDGTLYWREGGGTLYRAGMDEAEFSSYLN